MTELELQRKAMGAALDHCEYLLRGNQCSASADALMHNWENLCAVLDAHRAAQPEPQKCANMKTRPDFFRGGLDWMGMEERHLNPEPTCEGCRFKDQRAFAKSGTLWPDLGYDPDDVMLPTLPCAVCTRLPKTDNWEEAK